ncbi:GNAT family N-acetyltransferase [Georgenia sp. TF02-10]|uniref:GNAT family N-acetyltransferase n=1 Tax=Georgenia sp. TF02-10 TaxID=2917725 RepID=UPI001FA7F883|nr:GNAT family N-acetyltransferase [Georgenia sp. TF02-10]UNX54061.1 GNAT family N-acetyltransferase [Georgenia sp. TF02-10]
MPARFDEVSTPRLLLRRWRAADREPFAGMNADPAVMSYFPGTLTAAKSDAMVDRIEQHFEANGFGLWALEVRATGRFIGFTGLNPMPADVPADGYEVGWRLAADAWHHGYATEAGRAALAVALGPLGLAEVWSMTALSNTPSQAVMRRLGMRRWGEFDHPAVPPGPLRRHVLYRAVPPRGRATAADG